MHPPRREIRHRYRDPVDEIWCGLAARLGLRIERSDQVFASFDGRGVLTVGTPETLDPDDSLAQIIFHEVCHALVAGVPRQGTIDWGMRTADQSGEQDLVMEHACHRLQAALAARHGLRAFMAVTTDHRPYWDALPDDPLAACDDPALPIARQGMERALHGKWSAPLQAALAATRSVADAAAEFAPDDSLWKTIR